MATIVATLIIGILIGIIWFLEHNSKKEGAIMSSASKSSQNIRQPAVAGQFYPASADELAGQVDGFLDKAVLEKEKGKVSGLIVPHAGYVYSGSVAAAGFKQLEGADIDTVILIGNSHQAYFDGAAVFSEGYFATPLGEVEIDADLTQKLISESKIFKADVAAHEFEHSLEVQLPFLQRVLKNFKLAPILLGNTGGEEVEVLARAISKNSSGRNILLVASTDLSHYPAYEQANYADKKTCEAILTGQAEKLRQTIERLEKENIVNAQTFLCAQEAVEVLMMVMQDMGVKDVSLLKYANSGDAAGDKSQVVGYAAIGFYGEGRDRQLSQQEQQKLLEIARQSVEAYVKTGATPIFHENSAALNQRLGAFVTLKEKGELRGCIGNFTTENSLPLWQGVTEMAVAAATQDPRFSPISEQELSGLEYEVSVLSPLEKVADWREIELGKHGVEVKSGNHSGVFLPQVATETGWDLETFMGQLCSQKAGLSWDCWRGKDAEIYTFTAQVFGEK